MYSVCWKVPNTCKLSSYRFCSVEPLLVKDVNQDTYQWSWGLHPTSCLPFFSEVHQTLQRGDGNFYLPLALSTEVCDVVPATDKLEAREKQGEVHWGKANHPLLICGGKRRAGQCGWACPATEIQGGTQRNWFREWEGSVIPQSTEKTDNEDERLATTACFLTTVSSLFVW